MNTIDLTPLYRTMVGFDRLAGMIDQASRLDGTQGYPPYNIERVDDNAFAIEIAVAGFTEADIEIETKEGQLTIAGKKGDSEDADGRNFLHRGIAQRSFIRRFQLADHVLVTGATLDHGVLRIDLIREIPEEKKARRIEIGRVAETNGPKLIGKKAAGGNAA
jgi:molecular chaperone IbpA